VVLDHVQERVAVAVTQKPSDSVKRHRATGVVGMGRSQAECLLRLGRVEEVALEVEDLRRSDRLDVDVGGSRCTDTR
jgi:hypothetical protein